MADVVSQILKEIFSAERRKVYMLAIFVLSTILLLLPANVINFLGWKSIMSIYRPWISIAFLGIISLLAAEILIGRWSWLQAWWQEKEEVNRRDALFRDLTAAEQDYLQSYIINKTQVQVNLSDNKIANLLLHKSILFVLESIDKNSLMNINFYIESWAYEHLQKHPELIGIKQKDTPND